MEQAVATRTWKLAFVERDLLRPPLVASVLDGQVEEHITVWLRVAFEEGCALEVTR